MIHDRIATIEATLQTAPGLSDPTRQQLLGLLAELKAEVTVIPPAQNEQAQSIARSADAAFASAAGQREDGTPAALRDLRASVEGFEASHPKLVAVVDRIALTLSNMGI
jgi:hypothetical protein